MKRRLFLAITASTAAGTALVACNNSTSSSPSTATPVNPASGSSAAPREVNIVFDKFGPLAIVRQQKTLDDVIAGTGYSIRWREFAAGPQQLEALNAGRLDIARTAESLVAFSQA